MYSFNNNATMAQTGHLVLSTLHTNSAAETLTRLINMNVPTYNIASSVSLIIAQRLSRKLCNRCKALENLPTEILIKQGFSEDELGTLKIFKPVGCEYCTNGYKGRVGLFEVLPVTETISEIIMQQGSALDIIKQSRKEGMITIRRSGLEKIREGLTSLEEINRVTKD